MDFRHFSGHKYSVLKVESGRNERVSACSLERKGVLAL